MVVAYIALAIAYVAVAWSVIKQRPKDKRGGDLFIAAGIPVIYVVGVVLGRPAMPL